MREESLESTLHIINLNENKIKENYSDIKNKINFIYQTEIVRKLRKNDYIFLIDNKTQKDYGIHKIASFMSLTYWFEKEI